MVRSYAGDFFLFFGGFCCLYLLSLVHLRTGLYYVLDGVGSRELIRYIMAVLVEMFFFLLSGVITCIQGVCYLLRK